MSFPDVVGRFAHELRESPLHLSTFAQFPDPNVIEALARTGLQSIILDMQHGMFDEQAVLAGVAAAALSGKPVLVRLPVDAGGLASRVIDFGAAGVVCPMVNTADDARRLVALTKFPPVGQRSWGPRRCVPLSGLAPADYLRNANDLIFVFAMIETREALDNLDDILAVAGIDGVFVGPADLSVSLSGGTRLDEPQVPAELPAVAETVARHGKVAGIFSPSAENALDCQAAGFRFVALAQDSLFMAQAANAAVEKVRTAQA